MVDSSPGRTERPELRRLGIESRTQTEANHREVREPGTLLGLVDAEP
jgi:hypothetical protein